LAALREQQSGVPGITREQALTLSRSLRDALGETVLTPRIVDSAGGSTTTTTSRNKPPSANSSAAQAPAGAASAAKAKAEVKPKAKP
jgi:hypothetical protein